MGEGTGLFVNGHSMLGREEGKAMDKAWETPTPKLQVHRCV